MQNIVKKIRALLADKAGASAAEYALIIAVMGALVVVGVNVLGTAFGNTAKGEADRMKAESQRPAQPPAGF